VKANVRANRRATLYRVRVERVVRRRGRLLLSTDLNALLTEAESGKALAMSRSSTTTLEPSFRSRLWYLPLTAFE